VNMSAPAVAPGEEGSDCIWKFGPTKECPSSG
jgi:hypothetical protein